MALITSSHVTVQAKVQMLDNLLDIEVAYSLLRGGAQDNENDPIDINYEKLKTKIEVKMCFFFLQPLKNLVRSFWTDCHRLSSHFAGCRQVYEGG